MEKIINIENGKDIKLSSSAAFLYIYKNQFGREPLKDLMNLQKGFVNSEETDEIQLMETFNLEVIQNLAWALAKVGDYKGTPEPIEFYLNNPNFMPLDHVSELLTLALGSISVNMQVEEEIEEKN